MQIAKIRRNVLEVGGLGEEPRHLHLRVLTCAQPAEELENRQLIEDQTGVGLLRRPNLRTSCEQRLQLQLTRVRTEQRRLLSLCGLRIALCDHPQQGLSKSFIRGRVEQHWTLLTVVQRSNHDA